METTKITCSQGFGAEESNPPGGGIPVMEMEAELCEIDGIEMKLSWKQNEMSLIKMELR